MSGGRVAERPAPVASGPVASFHRAMAETAARVSASPADLLAAHGLLAQGVREHLPESARDRHRELARENLGCNLLHAADFRTVVAVLRDAGVEVCALKGIELLDSVYSEEPEARVLTDLDILVSEDRFDAAVRALCGNLELREFGFADAARAEHHARLLAGKRLRVDVHRRLGTRFARRATWEQLEPSLGRLHDAVVHRLDCETLFVHLAAHLVNNGPETRLAWIEDLLRLREAARRDAVLAGPAVIEGRLVSIADRVGARRALLGALHLLRGVAGDPPPPGVRSPGVDRFRVWLHGRLVWPRLAVAPFATPRSPLLARRLAILLLMDSSVDALRLGATRLRHGRRSPELLP